MSRNVFQDADTFDPQKLSEAFRHILPTDGRYVALYRQTFPPVNAISNNLCEFRIPAYSDIYLINDIKIALSLKIVTKDPPHVAPAEGAMVGPVNNVLASCLSEVTLLINESKGQLLPWVF